MVLATSSSVISSNDNISKAQGMKDSKGHPVSSSSRDRFVARDSPFTLALRSDPAVQAVYSICLGFAAFFYAVLIVRYCLDPSLLAGDVSFLTSCFAGLPWFFATEGVIHATFAALLLPSVVLRIRGRISPLLFGASVAVVTSILVIVPIVVRFAADLPVPTAVALSFEQVRLAMKLVSFVVEGERIRERRLQQQQEESKESADPDVNPETREPTLASLALFLFAPVLIYRNEYPRSPSREWRRIAGWSCEILALFWATLVLLRHGFLPAFQEVGRRELTPADSLSLLQQSCLLGSLTMLSIGYGFLHSWSNAWAEVLCFGDRMFYKNFLHSATPYHMLNKWNFLIHSWISEYLFKPMIRRTGNRISAAFVAFIVSMLAHDVVVAIPLRTPITDFTLGTLVVFALLPIIRPIHDFLQKQPSSSSSASPLNPGLFFIMFSCISHLVFSLGVKYFRSHNCPTLPSLMGSAAAADPSLLIHLLQLSLSTEVCL